MKKTVVRLFALFVAAVMMFSLSVCFASAEGGDIIVLFTNDVHCATEDYALLAAYRAEYIAQGHTVITVDAGDAIQGKMIGTLTEGSAIVDIMNSVGYDIAVPGNHEFDFTVSTFMSLVGEEAEFEYICANFKDLVNDSDMLSPYKIISVGDERIAFVGILTPETYSKSTPAYFQNENGEFIYSFMEDNLYETVQSAVDSALTDGATRVIAVGHLGITGITEGWRSIDVIENTKGIDAFIDGHAHEVIPQAQYKNIDGQDIPLASTGTALRYIGKMTISQDGIETELIDTETADISDFCDAAKEAYSETESIVNGYNEEFEYLFEEIGESDVYLTVNGEDGKRRVRMGETNAGDFVTDAYRAVFGTDIAFVNGGGVRAEVQKGVFTRKDIMDINPWNNEMCIIEITGSQLLDALEYGTHASPEEFGSFPQSSGITYELHTYIESGVVTDEFGDFVSIDESASRRVRNVKVNGKELELDKTYTLAGSCYMLLNSGYKMFADARIIAKDGLPTDTEVLVEYVTEHLSGKIPESKYGSLGGDGRITVITEQESVQPVVPGDESGYAFTVLLAVAALYIILTTTRKRAKQQ